MSKYKFEVDVSYWSPGGKTNREKIIIEQDSPNWNYNNQLSFMKEWVMKNIDKKYSNINVHKVNKI